MFITRLEIGFECWWKPKIKRKPYIKIFIDFGFKWWFLVVGIASIHWPRNNGLSIQRLGNVSSILRQIERWPNLENMYIYIHTIIHVSIYTYLFEYVVTYFIKVFSFWLYRSPRVFSVTATAFHLPSIYLYLW